MCSSAARQPNACRMIFMRQAGNAADRELGVYGKYTLINPFGEDSYQYRELRN